MCVKQGALPACAVIWINFNCNMFRLLACELWQQSKCQQPKVEARKFCLFHLIDSTVLRKFLDDHTLQPRIMTPSLQIKQKLVIAP